jgi:cell division septum initiation protein DivIVA
MSDDKNATGSSDDALDEGAGRRKRGILSRGSEDQAQRIRELEAELADLRSKRDLASLDEVELSNLAGKTAAAIIRAAQARHQTLVAEAESVLNDVAAQASEILTAASEDARKRGEEADAYGARIRKEADDAAAVTRRDADDYSGATRREAEDRASATVAAAEESAAETRARVDAEVGQLLDAASQNVARARNEAIEIERAAREEADRLMREATATRDLLLDALAQERKRVERIGKETSKLHSDTLAAFDAVRSLADQSTKRLEDAGAGAARVLTALDQQTERVSTTVERVTSGEGADAEPEHAEAS